MDFDKKVLALKLCDSIGYADMYAPLEEGRGKIIYFSSYGALVQFDNKTVFAALFDNTKASILASFFPKGTKTVEIHERAMDEYLTKNGFKCMNPCTLYVYDKKEEIPLIGYETITLNTSHLDLVTKHYHLFTDIPYFKERLENGYFMGLLYQGEIAGFIAEHSEGAMGMLEIFPQFRGKGLAKELEGAYINKLLKLGRLPYCNVVKGNTISEQLQLSLGLVPSPKIADWYNAVK